VVGADNFFTDEEYRVATNIIDIYISGIFNTYIEIDHIAQSYFVN